LVKGIEKVHAFIDKDDLVKELWDEFEEKFKNISGSCFQTYSCGDISIDDLNRIVHPQKCGSFFGHS